MRDLQDIFDEISVSLIGDDPDFSEALGPKELKGWFVVHDENECKAFFKHENDAYLYRLGLVETHQYGSA